jgi:cation diffusion facilitator CzcD-associated flavoprotein CzcO
MHNSTWKKEKNLLTEAYASIFETSHEDDRAALGPDEERQEDGTVKNMKTGETVYTPKKESVDDEISLPDAPELSGDTVDPLPDVTADVSREPDEVDAEIDSLKSLILNPPVDKIEEYARQGQLHVYVDMLKKKLEAAEAVKAAVRGEES